MISKELKKLSRRELVDVIYQIKKNEQEMQEKIITLQEALQDNRIRLSVAGSIAEAATDITQIFSAAQMTADLYLREIAYMKADTEQECARMLEEAQKKVRDILADGEKKLAELNACYQMENEQLQLLREEIWRLQQRRDEFFEE